ncbi:MAG: hypothetical protein AABZ60_10260 [Planctomycetota bacterium]
MKTVQEIQSAIENLSTKDFSFFREWFHHFDAEVWDKKFEEDVNSGKLNSLAKQAIADFQNGKCKSL